MRSKSLQLIAATFLAITGLTSNAQSWKLTGNSGIDVNNNFLGTTDAKPLILRTNNAERMRINKSGRIGIGVTNPGAEFNIAVSNSVTLTTTDSFLLGSISGSNLAFDYNEIQARSNGAANTLYLNYWGGDVWLGNRNGTAIPAIYTSTAGQVGIGSATNQAGFALTVNPFSSGGAIYINDPGAGNIALCTKSGSTGEGLRMNISSTTNPYSAIRGHTDGNGFGVLAEATGSTGIGIEGYSSQSYGLWAGTGFGTYAGYFSGSVYTSGTYNSSDEKLKQNIHEFSSAMDIIDQLHPKQYNYRQDGNYKLMNLPQGEHYGLIAQDVEKLLPGLVKETKFYTSKSDPIKSDELKNAPDIDFKALNYTELIPIMIKGMQEQHSIINEQQQQINELKQMVQTLSANETSSLRSSALNINGSYLQQNIPNPFSQNTVIRCILPSSVKQAQLIIYTADGKVLKSYSLNNNGVNEITINAGTLSSGQYKYALMVDGKQVDSKTMIVTK